MAEVIPVGYGKVRFRFRCQALPDEASTGIGFHAGLGVDIETAAADASLAYSESQWGAVTGRSDEWTYLGTSVVIMRDTGPEVGEYETTQPGTSTGDVLPANCSLLVTKNTGLGGRRNRGRMYWPPSSVPENNVDAAGFLESSFRVSAQSAVDDWFDAETAVLGELVLFHDVGGDVTPTPVASLTVGSQIATQRRRMR